MLFMLIIIIGYRLSMHCSVLLFCCSTALLFNYFTYFIYYILFYFLFVMFFFLLQGLNREGMIKVGVVICVGLVGHAYSMVQIHKTSNFIFFMFLFYLFAKTKQNQSINPTPKPTYPQQTTPQSNSNPPLSLHPSPPSS